MSIKVDDFEEVEHTEECIKKPLSEDEEEKVDRSTIYDIHRITGGSPYEINLICHHMYRRYIRQDLEQIDLSKPVLDDVLEELEGLRREGYHEIADKVGNLSRIQLQLLTSTLEFPNVHAEHFKKYALLDNIDELSRRDSEDIIENISQRTQELLSLDIIEKKDGKIKFSGSQFDSLYLRYYVASMDSPGTEISFHQGVEGQYVTNIFEKFTQKFFSDTRGSWGYANQPARINITDNENEKSQNREQDRFVKIGTSSGANTSQDLIQRAITTRGDILPVDLVPDEIISFRCNISWLNGGFTAILPSSDGERLEKIRELKRLLDGTGYNIYIESDYHYFCKGEQEREENNHSDALEYYDKADEINPYNKMTDLRRAEIEHKRGNSDEAIEKLNKICNNQSDWIYPFVSKGLIQIELGNDDGFDLLKSVLPEPVGITGIWETAVEKLDDIGETEKVNYLVGQAIEKHSSTDSIRVRLAHKLIKIGRPEDAIEFVERIDESDISDPLFGEYYYYSAIAMAKVGDYNDSIENLRLAFDDSDGYIDAVKSRDDLEDLKKTDGYDELINEFEKSEN